MRQTFLIYTSKMSLNLFIERVKLEKEAPVFKDIWRIVPDIHIQLNEFIRRR